MAHVGSFSNFVFVIVFVFVIAFAGVSVDSTRHELSEYVWLLVMGVCGASKVNNWTVFDSLDLTSQEEA